MKRLFKLGMLFVLPLLLGACHSYKSSVQATISQTNLSVERAKLYYDTYCSHQYTRATIDNRLPFVIGDAEWIWDSAEESQCDNKSAVDIPIVGGYAYKVYRQQSDGTYTCVSTSSKVVAVQDNTTGAISFYIRVSIPDVEDENAVNRTLNFEDKPGYNGLEYYITLDGCPAAITKFKDGVQVDGVFLGDETIDKREKIYKFADMLRGVCIARCSGTTRNDPEMEYGKVGETFVDQFGQLYTYYDSDKDGIADSVMPIFPEDIAFTIYFATTTNTGGGSGSGSSGTAPVAGSNLGTGTGTGGSAAAGGGGTGGSAVGEGTTTGETGSNAGTGTTTDGNAGTDTETDAETETTDTDTGSDVTTNIIGLVNPIVPVGYKKVDITTEVNQPSKSSINLGDSSKFVAFGTDGQTNCLTLCKMILNNYGITNYGSPNNVFKLMYEVDGQLQHYGDNVQQNYQNAIDCIDQHLEAGRPIIVGVNHTLDNGINEGTTDHFVVIYGRNYNPETGFYHYPYYEVARGSVDSGYNDSLNNFIYSPSDPPYFYDEISNRRDKKRYDVIQIRPNNGNTEGTISQFIK